MYTDELVDRWQMDIGMPGWETAIRKKFDFAFGGYRANGRKPRVLEIGPGIGLLLASFRRFGCTVVGVETSEANVRFARERMGLEIFHGRVEDAPLEANSFDLIIMDNLLEHLPDPVATLSSVTELLVSGGRVFIDTPNFEALERFLAGKTWGMYEEDHLCLFTPSALERLFKLSDLKVLAVCTPEPKESWGQVSIDLQGLGIGKRSKF